MYLQKLESGVRHNEMQVLLLGTNAATVKKSLRAKLLNCENKVKARNFYEKFLSLDQMSRIFLIKLLYLN